MGTPDFAASCLRALVASGENIVGCVTGADRARGRGMKLTPTPVKSAALEAGLPVFQPATLRGEDFAELLISLSPDLIIVAAYGKLLPENVLAFPRFGCVNAHASLLPKYRGAAPIQRAILAGEREIGVTAMKMEAGLDTGDMILTEKFDIADTDDFGTVHAKLAEAGGRAMVRVCEMLHRTGELPGEKQDDALSTYAEKITAEDMKLDFTHGARDEVNRIRAFAPERKASEDRFGGGVRKSRKQSAGRGFRRIEEIVLGRLRGRRDRGVRGRPRGERADESRRPRERTRSLRRGYPRCGLSGRV